MDLVELRTRSVGEQLAAVVAGIPHPERLIDAIVFESLIRRKLFANPPAEVQMLAFQHRISIPLRVEASNAELSPDAVRAVAKAAVLLEGDADFFEAVVLPRVLGGSFASELALTWMSIFRGQIWAVTAKRRLPQSGFYTVDRDEAVSLAAQGIRQVHIAGTIQKLTAAVVDPASCDHSLPVPTSKPEGWRAAQSRSNRRLKIPASRYQTLPPEAWPGLLEVMARAR